jgi:hypothetical protein
MKRISISYVVLFVSLIVLSGSLSHAQDLPEDFSASSKGYISIVDIKCNPMHYDAKWQSGKFKIAPSFVTASNITNNNWNFDSQIIAHSGEILKLSNTITTDKENASIHWVIDANGEVKVPTRVLALEMSLPTTTYAGKTVIMDTKEVELPNEVGKQDIYIRDNITRIFIPTDKGRIQITGKFKVQLVDLRKYNTKRFSMRIYFTPGTRDLTDAKLDMKIQIKTFESHTLDMSKVVNMAFADEASGDQKGGWTDQGAANDLRAMTPGKKNFSGISINVIDPKKNSGKSALVLRGGDRPYFPETAIIPTPQHTYKTLWILHTLAWGRTNKQIGTITAEYADGSTQSIPITGGTDVGDWWGANSRPNGSVVWSAPNGVNHVGLFLSRFKLNDKTLKQVTLTSTGVSVWAIVGMTVSEDAPPLPQATNVPLTIHADDQWATMQPNNRIVPGSVLDLSFLNDAVPAGIFGKIISRNGHLEFENRPGKQVRLFGPNVVYSGCFLPSDQAKQLAIDLRMMGYNYVRLHHFDDILKDKNGKTSYDFDPERFDQLMHWLACMKEQGIYVSLDLFTIRSFDASETGLNKSIQFEIKPLFQVDEIARESLEKWAVKLLCTKNPYTGMTLAEDPMLATLSLMNEEFLIQSWATYPQIKQMYLDAYANWLEQKNLPANPTDTSSPSFTQFLYDNSIAAHNDLIHRLDKHGIKPLFTANNADRNYAAALQRDDLDYVDNHFYHDHPSFVKKSWDLPYAFGNASALMQEGGSMRQMFPTRLWDKPFSISEFNFVLPNPYRGESGPLMGAYAALQDWDMLCRFQWSGGGSSALNPQRMRTFSVNGDPVNRMAERIIALLFKRGDVAKANKRIAQLVTPKSVYQTGSHRGEASFTFTKLGLISGVGMLTDKSIKQISANDYDAIVGSDSVRDLVPADVKFIEADENIRTAMIDANIIDANQWVEGHSQYISDTRQITLSAGNGKLTVDTPMSQAVVLCKPGSIQTSQLHVKDSSTTVTIALSSLDDKPISQSTRMVLMHITDVLNTNMRFADQHRRILTDWGDGPYVIKKATAKISIKLDHPDAVTVYAVDIAGNRLNKIASKVEDNQLTFTISTTSNKAGVMAYELVR